MLEADWLILIKADYLILIYLYKDDCLMLTNDWIKTLKAEYKTDLKIKKLLQQIEKNEEYYTNYNINKFRFIQKSSLLYISNIMKLKKKILQIIYNALLADYSEI